MPVSRLKLWLFGFAVALSAAISSGTVDAGLITNGGFESPVLNPANTYQPVTPSSWSGGALLFNQNGADFVFPFPQEGNQYEDIGNRASDALSQTFTVITGGDYLLSWYDNTGNVPATSLYLVTITDNSLNVAASQAFDAYHPGLDDWQNRFLNLTLSAGQYTLAFTYTGHSGLDTLIDNVSLDSLTETDPNGSVPEPSTFVMLLSGMTGLIGYGARRKNKS